MFVHPERCLANKCSATFRETVKKKNNTQDSSGSVCERKHARTVLQHTIRYTLLKCQPGAQVSLEEDCQGKEIGLSIGYRATKQLQLWPCNSYQCLNFKTLYGCMSSVVPLVSWFCVWRRFMCWTICFLRNKHGCTWLDGSIVKTAEYGMPKTDMRCWKCSAFVIIGS